MSRKKYTFDPYITVEFIEFTKDKPCLRVSDVAQFLRVSERIVRRWIELGELHAVRVSGLRIIPRSALWEFLQSRIEQE